MNKKSKRPLKKTDKKRYNAARDKVPKQYEDMGPTIAEQSRLLEDAFGPVRVVTLNDPAIMRDEIEKKNAPEAEKGPDFKCPICGGTEYKTYRSAIEPVRYGGPPLPFKIDGYSCAGCKVEFKDPVKFSQMRLVKARKKKRAAKKKNPEPRKTSAEELEKFLESVLDDEFRSLFEDLPKKRVNMRKLQKRLKEIAENFRQRRAQHKAPSPKSTGTIYR
jgi:hypothetical protein